MLYTDIVFVEQLWAKALDKARRKPISRKHAFKCTQKRGIIVRKRAKRKEEWTGPLICLSGVDVVYNTGTEALKNCNLKVEKGEFVFVVGSSGSGKSTLIKSLLGEIPLQAGEIQVGGNSLTEMKRKRMPYYRRKLGVVFQEFRLLDDRNVFENVALAQQVIGVDKDRIEKNVRGMRNW